MPELTRTNDIPVHVLPCDQLAAPEPVYEGSAFVTESPFRSSTVTFWGVVAAKRASHKTRAAARRNRSIYSGKTAGLADRLRVSDRKERRRQLLSQQTSIG